MDDQRQQVSQANLGPAQQQPFRVIEADDRVAGAEAIVADGRLAQHQQQQQQQQSQLQQCGSTQTGKSAFNWDIYKNRKTALQNLKKQCTLIDTILETEDGKSYEFVHSQVMSAFGERLNDFIAKNGVYVSTYRNFDFRNCDETMAIDLINGKQQETIVASGEQERRKWVRWNGKWPVGRVKLIRLPKLNAYTLGILVECAYSGFIKTDLPSGGIWQVLELADHYQMSEVIRACCTFLTKNLDQSNCVHLYHIGIKHRHLLQRCAWHKIRANFKHILINNLNKLEINNLLSTTTTTAGQSSDHLKQENNCDNNLAQGGIKELASGRQLQQVELVRAEEEMREIKQNNLATIKFEHFEPLLMHDKLNVDNEEMVWWAIRMWCNYNLRDRASKVTELLPCIRFARFKTGTDFSARYIWRDKLILENKFAQHQLAILDRNHRDYLSGPNYIPTRDGFALPCAPNPRQLRPRIPYSIMLAIGGWQQGQPTTLIESYDSNCNLWFECKKRIMSPLAYHGIENINGLLYICGGTDGSEILNEVFTYNPVTGDCLQRPSMREARCYVATANLNNYLYAFGGHNGLHRIKSVERIEIPPGSNMDGNVWAHVKDMNVARSDASACAHRSLIFVAGGLNDMVIESSVEFYNYQDDTWTFIQSMLVPRTSFAMLIYKDHLLAIGGNDGNERLASVESYSFKSKRWQYHSHMRSKRSTFSASLLDGNKLFVVGGYNGLAPFSQVEMFDELSGEWVPMQRIKFDRSGLKVVVVNDLPNAIDYTFLGST